MRGINNDNNNNIFLLSAAAGRGEWDKAAIARTTITTIAMNVSSASFSSPEDLLLVDTKKNVPLACFVLRNNNNHNNN